MQDQGSAEWAEDIPEDTGEFLRGDLEQQSVPESRTGIELCESRRAQLDLQNLHHEQLEAG